MTIPAFSKQIKFLSSGVDVKCRLQNLDLKYIKIPFPAMKWRILVQQQINKQYSKRIAYMKI
jgi:hypothetical protein